MKKTGVVILCCLYVLSGFAQNYSPDSSFKEERIANYYANRKFSYGVSESWYGKPANYNTYHATDVFMTARISGLNLGDASFELNGGIGFQPYQGTRLHAGFDYEFISHHKINFFFGGQYALGLKQLTVAPDEHSSIIVGYHSYLMPFMGLVWWPGKRDIKYVHNTSDSVEKIRYVNPTFWQLVYIKAQIGYSILISGMDIAPSATFDPGIVDALEKSTESTVYLKLGVGINLPTFGDRKRRDRDLLRNLNVVQ